MVLGVPASADGILDAVLEEEDDVPRRQISHARSRSPREGNSAGKYIQRQPEEKASTLAQRQQASLEEQNRCAQPGDPSRLLAEHCLEASAIKGTSRGGRLTREDVENIWRKSLKHPLLNLQHNPPGRAAKNACQ